MPKKDTFHETIKTALRKEGWNITNDPLFVPTEGGVNFFIDLGLEYIIGAEKEGRKLLSKLKDRHVHYTVFHFDILDGKVWIQENRTDVKIDEDLMAAGGVNTADCCPASWTRRRIF